MADLGTLNGAKDIFPASCPGPWYRSSVPQDIAADQSGRFQGLVTELGTPIKDVKVLLYYRPTGMLVGKTWTDASGAFQFTGLIPQGDLYAVVAQDPAGGTVYNDQIKLGPAPA